MKATGYIRRFDRLERFGIPRKVLREVGIGFIADVEVYVDGDCIIIEKHKDRCYICGNNENVKGFKDKLICEECIDGIKNL